MSQLSARLTVTVRGDDEAEVHEPADYDLPCVAGQYPPYDRRSHDGHSQSLKTSRTLLGVSGSWRFECPTSSYRRAFTNSFSSWLSHVTSSGKSAMVKYRINETTQVSVPSVKNSMPVSAHAHSADRAGVETDRG